jgi:hypothetical protein
MSADNEAIRASVLKAALELGVESLTFTEWMDGVSPSPIENRLSDKDIHVNHSYPLSASPGDRRYPYNNVTPPVVRFQPQ